MSSCKQASSHSPCGQVYVLGNMGRAGCSQKKCPHEAKPRAASFGNAPTLRVLPGKPLADFLCFHFSPDTHNQRQSETLHYG